MTCSQNIRRNDIGTEFIFTCIDCNDEIVDISPFSTLTVTISDRRGKVVEKTGQFYTDGTDGKLKYVSVYGDFDKKGKWQISAKVSDDDRSYSSTIIDIFVEDTL